MSWKVGRTLAQVEKETIEKALRFYDWNKTRTAQALRVSIRTIDNKIKRYNLVDPFKKADDDRKEEENSRPKRTEDTLSGVDLSGRDKKKSIDELNREAAAKNRKDQGIEDDNSSTQGGKTNSENKNEGGTDEQNDSGDATGATRKATG